MKTLINEVVNCDSNISDNPTFTYEQILIEGLQELNAVERKAIFLRFWVPCSIEQIATELKVSWDSADQIINGSINKLKNHFLKSNLSSSPFM